MLVGGLAAGVLELVDVHRREPPGDRLALEFELRRLTAPPLTARPPAAGRRRPRDTSE